MKTLAIYSLPFLFVSFVFFYISGRGLCEAANGCGWFPIILAFGISGCISFIFFLTLKTPLGVMFSIALLLNPFVGGVAFLIGSETSTKEYCNMNDGFEKCEKCSYPLFPNKKNQSICVTVSSTPIEE